MQTSPMETSYDEIAHKGGPFPQTHPDSLATLGHLFGVEPLHPLPGAGCPNWAMQAVGIPFPWP